MPAAIYSSVHQLIFVVLVVHSNVLFVCTANDESTIPGPLRDRMEIIRLSGALCGAERVSAFVFGRPYVDQYLITIAPRSLIRMNLRATLKDRIEGMSQSPE